MGPRSMLRGLVKNTYYAVAPLCLTHRAFKKRYDDFRRHAKRTRGPKRYLRLLEIIRTEKCKRILEIGTWNGNQALRMIEEAGRYHGSGDIEYYGLDLFELLDEQAFRKEISKWPPPMAEVEETLKKSGVHVHLYMGNTISTLPKFAPMLPKMDLIFIDGGHSLETIASDWRYVKDLMDDRTVVVFDDYWEGRDDDGCKSIVEAIDKEEYEVKVLRHHDTFQKGALKIHFVEVRQRTHASHPVVTSVLGRFMDYLKGAVCKKEVNSIPKRAMPVSGVLGLT